MLSLFDFNIDTKLYQLSIVHIILGINILLSPFYTHYGNDWFLTVLLFFSAVSLLYKNTNYLNFLIVAIFLNCFIFILRSLTLTIFDGCIFCFYVSCFILYLLLLIVILSFKVYYPEKFQNLCLRVNTYCVLSNFGFLIAFCNFRNILTVSLFFSYEYCRIFGRFWFNRNSTGRYTQPTYLYTMWSKIRKLVSNVCYSNYIPCGKSSTAKTLSLLSTIFRIRH